jgi:pSer/pThr/pTyr-binding forkhead associated (FHA) protein
MLTLYKAGDAVGEYVFTQPGRCVVGRAVDCDIPVPADTDSQDVSRHHCAFFLDPPEIRIRDLYSLNGTYVNGMKIGQRHDFAEGDEPPREASRSVELHAGDEVQLGQSASLRVSVSPPPDYAIAAGAVGREFDQGPPDDRVD